jgi:DNA-binding Xre family transcriptional regulator
MEIAHVHAMTFAGRGLLIESVPVAGPFAAHKNFSPCVFAEIIRQVHKVLINVGIRHLHLWASESPAKGAPIYQYHAPEAQFAALVRRYSAIEVGV